MRKKHMVILGGLLVFLLALASVMKILNIGNFSNGYKVTIENNSNKTIKNVELKYKVGSNIKIIDEIAANESCKENINTDNVQGENSIILVYKDINGHSHEECVVGYLEKGYSGKVKVNINKVNDDGKLDIVVK